MAPQTFHETVRTLKHFVGGTQLQLMLAGTRGEEGAFFLEKLSDLATTIAAMPEIYAQDGKGDDAIVHLHYFLGAADWYITERDIEGAQLQAFGWANLGDDDCAEFGYISIVELIENGVELDLHWTPKTLRAAKAAKRRS